jgi:hypothetical protein
MSDKVSDEGGEMCRPYGLRRHVSAFTARDGEAEGVLGERVLRWG